MSQYYRQNADAQACRRSSKGKGQRDLCEFGSLPSLLLKEAASPEKSRRIVSGCTRRDPCRRGRPIFQEDVRSSPPSGFQCSWCAKTLHMVLVLLITSDVGQGKVTPNCVVPALAAERSGRFWRSTWPRSKPRTSVELPEHGVKETR